MSQALVCGNVAPHRGKPVKFLISKRSYARLRCKTKRMNPRQCRTYGAYQQEVEETFRRKAPATAPGPDTSRRPPPPPPPPPPAPASGQVEPYAVCRVDICMALHHLSATTVWCLQFSGQTRRTMLALVAICSVAYGYNITQHPDAPPGTGISKSDGIASCCHMYYGKFLTSLSCNAMSKLEWLLQLQQPTAVQQWQLQHHQQQLISQHQRLQGPPPQVQGQQQRQQNQQMFMPTVNFGQHAYGQWMPQRTHTPR